MDALDAFIEIEIEVGRHVDFVHQQHIADGEHQRVLQGLVVALGNGEDHGVFHGAGVELGGADEVANVLQNGEIYVLGAEAFQTLLGHAGVQVAHAAGVELDDLHAAGGDGGGVHVGVDVRFHDADAHIVFQRLDGGHQSGGLAGAGGAHQVQQESLLLLQLLAQLVRLAVVRLKNALFDFQYAVFIHGSFLL